MSHPCDIARLFALKEEVSSMSTLEVDSLTKVYGGFTAVKGIRFAVRAGTIAGLLGPNGAGKTTTISCITGIIGPTAGDARICAHSISKAPLDAKRCFAFVPDSQETLDDIAPIDLIRFMGCVYEQDLREVERTGLDLMNLFGILDRSSDLMRHFSHGMKKKTQFAAAIAVRPSLLVMDEPTSGLDPVMIVLLKDLLRELANQGMAILVGTHNLPWAEDLCDEIYLIHNSELVAAGPPSTLLAQYGVSTLEDAFVEATGGAHWRAAVHEVVGRL
jgi:ABC-2 type transport system ATP-binding protein